jgi:hypothetical protein
MIVRLVLATLLLWCSLAAAVAAPSRIIILRHGKKEEEAGAGSCRQYKKAFVKTVNQRTQEAVADLMANPAWQGKTVVMVWEHKHIANAKLERSFPGEKVTLRQLLGLDTMKDVPDTWPDGTYDYFWIVDFDQIASRPTGFRMVKQVFNGAYADVPSNDWGAPDGLTAESQCNLKGAD